MVENFYYDPRPKIYRSILPACRVAKSVIKGMGFVACAVTTLIDYVASACPFSHHGLVFMGDKHRGSIKGYGPALLLD